ncbi:MAG: hypothetical protein MJ130_08760, partial [Lachnospiraceae bacterium]|nr:hypothetical protein [Lachnospiraceae bacterium]
MNIKRKVTRRIATWFLCLAMVLTTINLPAFTVAVSADTGDEEIVPVLEGDAELSYNGKERIFVITNIDENVVKYNISRIADAGDSYREAYDSESGTLTITATNVCKFEVKFEKKDGTYWSDGNQYKIIELKINRLIIPLPYYDDIVEATGSNTIITRVRYSYLGIEAIRVEAVAETGVSCVKNPSDHMSEENKYYIISTTSTGIKKVKFSLTDTRNLVWEDGEVNERIKEYEVVDKICTSATRYHIFSSDCDAICNVCGYERVASNTHNFVDQGNGNHKCSTCGSVEGHEFADQGDGNHKCTKCDSQGTHDMTSFSYDESSHTLMCSFCGFTNPRIYGKPFHSFSEWRNGTRSCKCGKTEVCDHDGITTGICSNCGIEFSHVKGTLHEAKPATCETDGTIEYYECAGCGLLLDGNGNEISDITDESALGHSFTNYKSDNNATCTLDGTKTAKCDRCDVTDTKADTGSATGIHDFSQNGTCACGLIQIEF